MKRASAIVTNRGGRTCHAAIIARELGIPAVVGCGNATALIARGATGHGLLRRGRHGLRLRRRAQLRADAGRTRRDAAAAGQDHDERRQPRPGVRLRGHPQPRRRPRTARVHHQPDDRRPSARPARLRPARRRTQGHDPPADGRLPRPGRVLRREALRRHRHDRRRVRAGARDRAPLGLQVERVRQPDRRPAVRAGRGEPDARVPRRGALRRRELPPLLRARVPRAAARARRDGPEERLGDGAVRAHAAGGRAGRRSCSRRTASSAARTGSRSS